MYKLMLLTLLAFAPAGATIASTKNAPEPELDLSASFEAQRDVILKELDGGDKYRELDAESVLTVKQSLAQITRLLDGAESVERLPPVTKVEVFNQQERVNTLLGQARADSRMVCKREKATGSNRPSNMCLTVAQRRRANEAAKDFLLFNPRSQGPVGTR